MIKDIPEDSFTSLDHFTKSIQDERAHQLKRWGGNNDFDKLNTANDWVAYIVSYLGRAVTMPWDSHLFETALVKVATLCFVAWNRSRQGAIAPRHYD